MNFNMNISEHLASTAYFNRVKNRLQYKCKIKNRFNKYRGFFILPSFFYGNVGSINTHLMSNKTILPKLSNKLCSQICFSERFGRDNFLKFPIKRKPINERVEFEKEFLLNLF